MREFSSGGKAYFKNVMKELLPERLIGLFAHIAGMDPEKAANQITKHERNKVMRLLKALPLTVIGSRGMEYAMVTSGGIPTKEINPKTMESKRVKGLYFAGEILDIDGITGGFNFQNAWTTGYLAGSSAIC